MTRNTSYPADAHSHVDDEAQDNARGQDGAVDQGLYWICWLAKPADMSTPIEKFGIAHVRGRRPFLSVRVFFDWKNVMASPWTMTAEECRSITKMTAIKINLSAVPDWLHKKLEQANDRRNQEE